MKKEVRDMMLFQPSVPFKDDRFTHGILSYFEPGTTVLKKAGSWTPDSSLWNVILFLKRMYL